MKTFIAQLKKLFRKLFFNKFISIRRKFLGSVFFIIIFFGGINSYIAYRYTLDMAHDDMDRNGDLLSNLIRNETTEALLTRDIAALNTTINEMQRTNPEILYIVVVDSKKNILGHTFSSDSVPLFVLETAGHDSVFFFHDRVKNSHIRHYTRQISKGSDGRLLIGLSDNALIVKVHLLSTLLLIVNTVSLLLVLVLFAMISNLINRPIQHLLKGFVTFVPGHPVPSIPTSFNDEMRMLIIGFRDMAERLNTLYTEFKETQVKIIETEKMASLGILASGIAHEISNPITGIEACAYRLFNSSELSPKMKNYIDLIIKSTQHIGTITKNLLQYARQPDQKKETIDLRSAVVFALHMLGYNIKRNNISVIQEYPDCPCMIFGINTSLVQVVFNAILNAIDAMPGGGTITITIKGNCGRYLLSIADTGIGINPEIIGKVFDPFFTTKGNKGTGLGLYVSYNIIKAHNGTISLSPGKDQGAVFSVSLEMAVQETNVNTSS